MEVFLKIIVSIIAFGVISVFTAFAVGAPVDKKKSKKLVEIKQQILFVIVLGIAFYLIWTY